MANSSIVGKAKNAIIRKLIQNEDIVKAINATNIEENDELINTHIFNYDQNPNTINDVLTFIIVLVHIPKVFDKNKTFVEPTVEIKIISNERHMKVTNIPKIRQNRNDYLAELIDNTLNGCTDIGLGELVLESNVEGVYQTDYLYRRLLFSTKDLNKSMCLKD